MLKCEEDTIRLVYFLIVDFFTKRVVEFAKMKEMVTEGLTTLCSFVFKVEFTLLFDCLRRQPQLLIVMEILVIVFSSVDTVHWPIVGFSELLQPFLREEVGDWLHHHSAVGRKTHFSPARIDHRRHFPPPIS
jgi:hypothetical protein